MQQLSIVGGGIAGLALAAVLDPQRWRVTLLEERPDRTEAGTSLGMFPDTMRALDVIGIGAPARDAAPHLSTGEVRNAAGEAIAGLGGARVWLLPRPTLVGLLDAAVPDSVRRVTRMVTEPGDLGGPPDVVVGADGVHSALRRSVWGGSTAARRSRYVVVRGVIDGETDRLVEHWGPGAMFGTTPHSPGRLNWFAAFGADDDVLDGGVAGALREARERYARFPGGVRGVLATATPEDSLAQRLWTAPPLARYVRGRVVLVGDAAHAMTPNLGRGACTSIEDAVTLGTALNRMPVGHALARYQLRRWAPTQATRCGAAAVMAVATLEQRRARVRDVALRPVRPRATAPSVVSPG